MAQEKISFNASLMSLPLQADPNLLSRCDCREDTQIWDIDNRILSELPKNWQPGLFFIRKADANSAKFSVNIYNGVTNTLVKTLASGQLVGVKTYRQLPVTDGGQAWDTVVVPAHTNLTVDMAPGVYYLTVAGLRSELFRVLIYDEGDLIPPREHLLFSLSNPTNLSQVPYQTGYVQTFGLPGVLCAGEPKTYTEADASKHYGDRVTYLRQYRVWTIDWIEVTPAMTELLKSMELHQSVIVQDHHRSISLKIGEVKATIKEDTCCTLGVSLTLEETLFSWGVCAEGTNQIEQSLTTADIGYADPADSDNTTDPYIPPAGNPVTTDATVPIAGTVVSETTETTDCGDAFIDITSGLKYQTMVTIARANGSGGTVPEFSFSNPCPLDPATVPVPRIRGQIGNLVFRVGQSINIQLLDLANILPATGSGTTPVVSVSGLPNGVVYSGGRLSGTPTESGSSDIEVLVSQPGAGSVVLPATITTISAAPTVTDVGINLTTHYDAASQELTVTVESPFAVELKIDGAGTTVGFVDADGTGVTDQWEYIFPDVVNDGRVSMRRNGDSGNGISFPFSIGNTSGLANSFPFKFTNPSDDQHLALKYNPVTNSYDLVNVDPNSDLSDLQVITDRGHLTTNPIALSGVEGNDYERNFEVDTHIGGWRLKMAGTLRVMFGHLGSALWGWKDSFTGYLFGLREDTFVVTTPKVDAHQAEVNLRTSVRQALVAGAGQPIQLLGPQSRSAGGYDDATYSAAQITAWLWPNIAALIGGTSGGSTGGTGRQTHLLGCFSATPPPDGEASGAITPEMIGVNQSHNLQTNPTNITWFFFNKNGQPETEMASPVTVTSTYWRLDYPEGGSGYEGGKFFLKRNSMNAGLDIPGGTPYTARVFGLIDPATGDDVEDTDGVIAFYAPPSYTHINGVNPSEGVIASWRRYLGSIGSLSSDCIPDPDPSPGSGDPTWNISSLGATAVSGAEFSADLYWDTAGTPHSGSTIARIIEASSLPSWLTLTTNEPERKTSLRGTVPVGLSSFSVSLLLLQSPAGSTPRTFTQAVSSASVRLTYAYNPLTNEATFYEGDNGVGVPTIQLRNAPAAYTDRAVYNMDRLGSPASISSVLYYFTRIYPGIVTGQYDIKTIWLGVTLFGTIEIIEGRSGSGVITLTSTDPGDWTGSGPIADGEPVPYVNTPPVRAIATGFLTCNYNIPFSHSFPANMFTDADGDPLTWSLEYSGDGGATYSGTLPGWCAFNAGTRTFTGTSVQVSSAYFRKKVTDPYGGAAYDPFFLLTVIDS